MNSGVAFNVSEIERQVNEIALEIGIKQSVWHEFMNYLAKLKRHNILMYTHSLRVGIYAQGIARDENWEDPKFPFFGGCGHDYGKCLVPNSILNAKHYDEEKYEKVKQHSFRGFEALKDKYLFTAFIAGLHHKYQLSGNSSYGIDLKNDSPIALTEKMIESINRTAELVALCDFFDAITTRQNDKGLVKNFGDMAEAKLVMLKHFLPWSRRVEWLFDNRIE